MPALITSGTAYTASDLVEAYGRADDLARGLRTFTVKGRPDDRIDALAWRATRAMIADHARISAAIDTAAHAARTHVRRSIGQQFRRAREQLGLAHQALPPHQEEP